MSYHLGVDLGTTYMAAAVARGGRAEVVTLGTSSVAVPSVVHLGDDRLLVGEPAARRAVTEPERVAREFKRRVGDPTPLVLGGTPLPAELLMARSLAWVVDQVATTEGRPPASLAVAHPANWGAYKLDLLRQAVRHVGVEVDLLVPEPIAAATSYASERPLEPGTVVAVYDLGGGTFDAAVVRAGDGDFQIVGRPEGIERLGGVDVDHAVLRHVLGALALDPDSLDAERPGMASALAQLRNESVAAKEALSAETDVSIPVMLPERHTEVRLTRAELEAMIRPTLAETVVALHRAITSAGVAVEDVSAVLLVGGSSRIPLVAQMVTAELGRPVAVDARPKDAVPMGAALAAHRAASSPGLAAGAGAAAGAAAGAVAGAALAGDPPGGAAEPGTGATPGAATAPGAGPPAGGMASPGGPPAGVASPGTGPPAGVASPGGPPTPPGLAPAPAPSRSGGSRRALLAGAAALLAVGGLVGAVLAADRGSGDSADGTTTTTGDASTTTEADTTTTSGTDGTTGTSLDLGGLGTSGDVPDPLPGDDWSDEARAAFVDTCTDSGIGTNMSIGGTPPTEGCGCLYDELSRTTEFADFNEAWTAEDVDPDDPTVRALTSATFSCTLG